MCNPASMIIVHKNAAKWSEKTDSHHEIIKELGIRETDARGNINIVPVEITPSFGNLSKPLKQWEYAVDYYGHTRELPEWYDAVKAEAATRSALVKWAECKLKGWKVREAFNPINPLLVERDESLDVVVLLADWDSVRDSVGDSVWDSVRDSVRDSVGAYIGSLFHNIKDWKYTDRKNPWRSLRKLWLGGYVPSFDGKTWRLHSGPKAKIVFEITQEELMKT